LSFLINCARLTALLKTGTITIKNPERNKNLRFFQSWRSAVSEHLEDYDSNMTAMTKEFVNELLKEL
jgi:hypothetical protein